MVCSIDWLIDFTGLPGLLDWLICGLIDCLISFIDFFDWLIDWLNDLVWSEFFSFFSNILFLRLTTDGLIFFNGFRPFYGNLRFFFLRRKYWKCFNWWFCSTRAKSDIFSLKKKQNKSFPCFFFPLDLSMSSFLGFSLKFSIFSLENFGKFFGLFSTVFKIVWKKAPPPSPRLWETEENFVFDFFPFSVHSHLLPLRSLPLLILIL